LVTLVTPPVNAVRSPRTPAEKAETLLTTEAAKDDPGRAGMEIDPRPPEGAGTEPVPVTVLAGIVVDGVRAAGEPKDGSNLHHQVGAGMKTGPLKVCWVRVS